MKKIKGTRFIAAVIIGLACLLAPKSEAQVSQFASSSQCVSNLTSPSLYTAQFTVTVPAISLTIQATNALTILTNTLNDGINVNGTQLVPQSTFVYNAATMGTNFSTNWPSYQLTFTNYLFGQAILQNGAGGTVTSNTVSIR